jgi:cytochrome P450
MLSGFTKMMTVPFPFVADLPTPTNISTKRALAELDRVVHQIIADRRQDPGEKTTLLNMLIDARNEDGEGMSDAQLRDEVLTLLLAGHETTANALNWTFYMLSKHPAVARKLEEELDTILDGDPPTMEQVRELPYTTQVIKESMRLFPPVWMVGRRAEVADELCGYEVPKGALVLTSPYVLHRHPDHWENPEGFDPERFAPGRPAPARGTYMPFIVGARKCIGEHFAMTELVIIVATLLQRYRLEVMPGHKIEAEASVTLRPKHGIKMRIIKRH